MKTNKQIIHTVEQNVDFPINKTESAQINVPKGATNTQFYFPTLPLLQDAHLLNMEIQTVDLTPNAPDNTPLLNKPAFLNAFLTLVNYNGKQIVHQLPLVNLVYGNLSGVGFTNLVKQFKGQRIDWQKSYIQFSSNANISAVQDETVLFTVYYADVVSEERKDNKSSFHNRH